MIRSLYNLFHKFEPVIFGLLPPSRLNNHYCKAIPSDQSKLFKGCKAWRTYRGKIQNLNCKNGLNLSHIICGNNIASKPRIEFRHSAGTLNVEKSRNWLRFLLQMTEHACARNCQSAKQVANNREGLEKLLICCGFKGNKRGQGTFCR